MEPFFSRNPGLRRGPMAEPRDEERGRALLAIAREAIAHALLGSRERAWPDFAEPGASFVTLRLGGELRGCIGSLEAHRPLAEDVRCNAVAAALRDPRFPPLSAAELGSLSIEVSELTPIEPIVWSSQSEALAALRPFEDGVVLEHGPHRATFLPQVWEQLPQPADFLRRLAEKAGLPAGFWHPELRLYRYGVRKWEELRGASPT